MKKKTIALILSLVLCLSAGILPAMSADAAAATKPLEALGENLTAAAEQPVAVPAATNRVAAVKIGSPTAMINGQKTQIDPANNKVVPIIKDGRTMVPLRFSASAMGGTTQYISDADYITVRLGNRIARFKINSKSLQIASLKGKPIKRITMDVAATKVNGRVMVPLRAVSEGLGCSVYYKKFPAGEIVVVSLNALTAQEKEQYMALLLNLSKYTFTNKPKTCSISLPGAWDPMVDDNAFSVLTNMLYPAEEFLFMENVTPASAKNDISSTQTQIKEKYASYWDGTLVAFSKPTINGKAAVCFSIKMVSEGHTMYVDYCIIASKNVGMSIRGVFNANSKARDEFKTATGTIKLLK